MFTDAIFGECVIHLTGARRELSLDNMKKSATEPINWLFSRLEN